MALLRAKKGLQVNHHCVENHPHYRKELEIVGHLSGGRGDANKAGFE
jgi:hypothetical protein